MLNENGNSGSDVVRKANKRKQYTVLRGNAQYILQNFDEIFGESEDMRNLKEAFIKRFSAAQQRQKHQSFAELQRDLGACLLLKDNGYDFTRYIGDTSCLYETAQRFIEQTGSCENIAAQFPQMVQDVIRAIETDGHEPPADEMQEAGDYFAERMAAIV